MNANKILKARKLITSLDYSKCKILAEEILKLVSTKEVKEKLENFLDK